MALPLAANMALVTRIAAKAVTCTSNTSVQTQEAVMAAHMKAVRHTWKKTVHQT